MQLSESLLDQAAVAFGAYLDQRLAGLLAQPVSIVKAPPAQPAEYPAVAVQLEGQTITTWTPAEVDQLADGSGPAVGANATLERQTHTALAAGVQLMSRGAVTGRGRLWIGTRLPPQRSALGEVILALFGEDDTVSGRIDISLASPVVLGHRLPWAWPFTVLVDDEKGAAWQDEMSFAERLWAYLDIEIEIALLLPRSAPLVTELTLALAQDLDSTVAVPADLDTIAHEDHAVAADGSTTLIP